MIGHFCRRYVLVLVALVLVPIEYSQAFRLGKRDPEIYCDPEEHVYYHEQFQICKVCDPCWSGTGLLSLQGADLGVGLHGATRCLRCRPCQEGTFNDKNRAFQPCRPCTVCSELNKIELSPCFPNKDAICGNTSTTETPIENEKKGKEKRDIQEPKHDPFNIHLVVFVILSLFILLLIWGVYLVVKYIRKRSVAASQVTNDEDSIPLNPPSTPETRDRTDLSTICEQDEDGSSEDVFELVVQPKRKDKNDNLKQPLLPQRHRRANSIHVDYRSTWHEPQTDNFLSQSKIGKRRFHRQLSQPVTSTEVDRCKKEIDNGFPSTNFIQYLSKLLGGGREYRKFAKKFGVDDLQTKLIETEYGKRTVADVSYEVLKVVFEKNPSLTMNDIYVALDDLGFGDIKNKIVETRNSLKL